MGIVGLLVIWLVTAVSLLIISYIPFIGVEIDSFPIALISALVFGLLNAVVGSVLRLLTFPLNFITFGLVYFIINVIIFGLAAALVTGFRLRNNVVSAILGAILLGLVNSLIFQLLGLAHR